MIAKTIGELDKIFELLNKEFFEAKLVKPMILIQSKVKKNTLGTCSCDKIWQNKNQDDDTKYEITLSGAYLNRTLEQIVATLLHEMIHLHCSENKIQDTSNNCVYHNKNFKIEAENRGLIISKAPTIGWSLTELKDETKELIKKFNINDAVFDYYRKIYVPAVTKKIILNKYICPQCGLKLSSYKEVNLICGDCKISLDKI